MEGQIEMQLRRLFGHASLGLGLACQASPTLADTMGSSAKEAAAHADPECIQLEMQYCIPAAYEAFYDFTFYLIRPPSEVDRNGPVFILIETSDNFQLVPNAQYTRLSVAGSEIFFRHNCNAALRCDFEFGMDPFVDGLEDQRIRRTVEVRAKTENDLLRALDDLRFCVRSAMDCPASASISFSELRVLSKQRDL